MSRLQPTRARPAQRLRLPQWALVWLLLALCWTPLWSQMHQTVHGGTVRLSTASGVDGASASTAQAEARHGNWGDLHDHTALECAVLDQLVHGFATAPEVAAVVATLPAAKLSIPFLRPFASPWRFLPEARAPPAAQ